MNPQEINKFLRATPFVPFRVHASDGKQFDIKHPEMAFLTRIALIVARPVADPIKDISGGLSFTVAHCPAGAARGRVMSFRFRRAACFLRQDRHRVLPQIHLASSEMLLTTSPRLAMVWAGCRGHRSRGSKECFRNRIRATEKCDGKKYGGAVHSRFAGQELDLICNHNFV
jgi:hypothetical protein